MSKITLHLFCAGLLFCFYSVHAMAEDNGAIKQCAQEKVAFDGIKPLKYADITGEANAHIPLWHQHPVMCSSTDEAKCKGKAYLVPGNTVAIANTCGDYAHVQYIGERTVSYGWVERGRLKPWKAPPHPEDMTPHAVEGSNLLTQRYPFKLLKGHGVPVCEAYLQRLNQTEFPNLPSCGRPENVDVPGFAWLNREWVGDEEFNNADSVISGFLFNELPHPNRRNLRGPFTTWRYNPQIDIDNDGAGDNLWIWNMDKRDHPDCGNYYYGNLRQRGAQDAVILSDDGSQVDKDKSVSVFSRSRSEMLDGHLPLFMGCAEKRQFCSIGRLVGIFKYGDLYYFDTFYDNDLFGDFRGRHPKGENLNDTLAVLQYLHGQTKEICTYFLMDDKQGK